MKIVIEDRHAGLCRKALGHLPRLTTLLLAAMLVACAPKSSESDSAEVTGEATDAAQTPLTPSPLGHYLAARQAQRDQENGVAADFLSLALTNDPDNAALLAQSFLLLASEGRFEEAAVAAEKVLTIDPNSATAPMVLAFRDMQAERWAEADRRLAAMTDEGVNRFVVPLLRAWLAASLDPDQIDARLAALENETGTAALVALHRGAIAELLGRNDEAAASYEPLLAEGEATQRVIEIVGKFLQRQGEGERAQALYDLFLSFDAETTILEDDIAALAAGQPPSPEIGSIRDGLAETYFNLSALLIREQIADTAMVFARMAVVLRPDFPVAQTLLAQMLRDQERYEAAIAIYRSIDLKSPYSWGARLDIADLLDRLERREEAGALLTQMAAERVERYDAPMALGNLYRREERFADAAAAYDQAVARVAAPAERHWALFYFRGIARERIKEWDQAEADFLKALELKPEQPHVMNYLAYSWVEFGERYDEALEMLTRAVELQPEDGFIVDSLGWVYYRLKQYDQAVVYLERAVALEPADPVINDHLGDAYWQVGRKTEARFQWQRALSFEPESDQIEPIQAKIERGLGATPVGG